MIIGIDASRAFISEKTGTENYSLELIRALLELKESQKHKFRLYVKLKGPTLEWLNKENVRLVEIKWPRLWTQGGLAWECFKKPPDVLFILAHTLPVLRRPGLKTVVTIHGLEAEFLPEYYQFPQKLYLTKSTEYAVKQATKLIAVSNWTKDELVKKMGADKDKIKVIYEGVGKRIVEASKRNFSKEYLRQIRHKYNLKKPYILFVGTIQPRKNLVRLIEAFSELRECELVIAGKKGWMDEEIYKAPEKFGVKNKVKFIGRVAEADLPAVYKMAEVFCYPSLMEGFGLPVLEAMSLGVPVVTSNKGALPEVAGQAALLIDPKKTSQISQALKLVLENQDLRQGLREKGFKRIKKFSWHQAAKETLKVLVKAGRQ